MTTPEPLVRYAAAGPVVTLTLTSPANRNALSRRLVAELLTGLERAETDGGVRVVVIRAEGPVFCSGADLSEALEDGMSEGARTLVELQRRVLASPVPVVVRVHGAARAGGVGLVAAADLAVASQQATFALTEVRLGLAPTVVSLTVLPRLSSRSAARAFLGGEPFSGTAAAAAGLVTLAVPEAELDAEVERVVGELLRGHPQGLRETKRVLNAALLERIERDGPGLAARSADLFASPAAREAIGAFLDRGR
jgi:enoyl-CoA hydratase/methylglutaconyl-CoA hydratase